MSELEEKKSVEQEYEEYSKLLLESQEQGKEASITNVWFDEKSKHSKPREANDIGIDGIYSMQHQYGIGWMTDIVRMMPQNFPGRDSPGRFTCVDVGSQTEFATQLATFANFIIVDPSFDIEDGGMSLPDLGIVLYSEEGQDLNFIESGSMCMVSSFHAIEHFGLGRYGDSLDPFGDIAALKEFNRVLCDHAWFMGSVPITASGHENVQFNDNRIYSPTLFRKMLDEAGFDVQKEVCAVSTVLFTKTVDDYGGKEFVYPAGAINIQDYEEGMAQFIEEDPVAVLEENQAGHAAYIWLAQKRPGG